MFLQIFIVVFFGLLNSHLLDVLLLLNLALFNFVDLSCSVVLQTLYGLDEVINVLEILEGSDSVDEAAVIIDEFASAAVDSYFLRVGKVYLLSQVVRGINYDQL